MRIHNWRSEDGSEYETGISLTLAKQLLKSRGGCAWTEHIDRDGCCFETSEIKLKGNNNKVKYNHHL